MASSDDEEIVPKTLTNYYFVDNEESPISFAVLPLYFDDGARQDAGNQEVFLHGTSDGGLQKIYKQVVGWKLRLEDERPRISVLLKDKMWIDVVKPRKSYYEKTIRSAMITIQLLHFLRRKPQASEKSLWEHLLTVFSIFDVRPSADDVYQHLSLLRLWKDRNENLANSQLLDAFLEGKIRKRSIEETCDISYVNQSFIAEDDEVDEDSKNDDGDNSDEESDLFDSVCAICDNGGDILCCEGPCLRSFHPTKKSGEESNCKSLGYTSKAEVDSIQNFLCNNCLYKQHQCFGCGKLGSSDAKSTEVYPCVSATCGHFYHPKCVAELLFPVSEAEASELQKNIIAGESFTCPVHKCVICKQGEDKEDKDKQFAMCRRCPKSYHRKCLPRKITFDYIEDEDIIVRAWDGLLPNRVLIYCLDHEIDEEIGTPIRNHITFPENPEKKKISDEQKRKFKVLAKKKTLTFGGRTRGQTTVEPAKVIGSEKIKAKEKVDRSIVPQALGLPKKEMPLKDKSSFDLGKKKSVLSDSKIVLKEKKPTTSPMDKVTRSAFPCIDRETEESTLAIFKKVSSTLRLEDIIRKHSMPSTHSSSKHIDRNVTLGRIEASVEAIRTALRKLENGATVEDAKAVCEPELLKQVVRWREKFKVYLAPFLHGMRYTSFGRHFTKIEKLREIVEKIQWYVQDGDTVVDFCCGANDFSILMKEKLDAAGKKCNFKNYDIIQPKNDFCFERRDWMTVTTTELPTGSKLIMGLNPPFGVKAYLANKFIGKALRFKPKLIVLVVPEETERLDKKNQYDLIWKDGRSLSGKSFYLPGSVDVYDKQMEQWNGIPPPLFLWSRTDWTGRHKEIATRHGHTSSDQEQVLSPEQGRIVELLEHVMREDQLAEEIRDIASDRMQASNEDNKIEENDKERVSAENHNNGSCKRRKLNKRSISEERMHDEGSERTSISPERGQPESRNWSNHAPTETAATSLGGPSSRDARLDSGTEICTIAGGNDIFKDIVNDDIVEMPRRYTSPAAGESMLHRSSHSQGWQSGRPDSYDYEMVASYPPRFSDNRRDNREYFARSPYVNDVGGGYRRSSEAEMRERIRLYGVQDQNELSQRRGRHPLPLGGLDAGYAQLPRLMASSAFALSPASTVTSAEYRYAPPPGEANFARPPNHLPTRPFPGRGGAYEQNMHGMRGYLPTDFTDFATGPHPSYSHPGASGGWFDD